MSRNYALSFLILEGNPWEYFLRARIPRQTLISAMVGACMKVSQDGEQGQVKLLVTLTPWDTALALKYIHDRVINTERLIRKPYVKRQELTVGDMMVSALMAIPSIGESTARAISKKFGSWNNLLNAPYEELQTVEGVGPKRASLIHKFLYTDVREGSS